MGACSSRWDCEYLDQLEGHAQQPVGEPEKGHRETAEGHAADRNLIDMSLWTAWGFLMRKTRVQLGARREPGVGFKSRCRG